MDRLKAYQFVMSCILVSWGSYAWATAALPFGQTQTGTISSTAQTNSYTFSANVNDVIDFTLVATSGKLAPKIQLYSSAGTLIGSNYSGSPFGCSGTTLEMNTIELPATGSYTVDVSDCSSTNTGSYALYTQRTNNPTGAAALPFGQPEDGTIGSVAQSSSYTFSANASDEVDFTLVATSGNLVPKIRLYNPSGTLLGSNYSGSPFGCSGTTLELNTVAVPTTGTYTVLIGDCADTNTGNYEVYLQRTDSPPLPMGLLFGQVQTGSIGSVAQSSTYTFSANANDAIDFTLVATSGSLAPKIRLYNPSGTLLSSNYSGSPFGCSGTTLELNTVSLPDTGTYTVLIGDCSDTNTGNYAIYSQRTNNPTGAANLPFAQTQTGLLGSVAGSNTYTFSANANDVVDFTLVTTNGSLAPKIRLYNPVGTLLSSNYSGSPFGCSGTTLELNTVSLPDTGTYTVLIGDCSDTNTGNYVIYTQRTNNPVLPTVLFWGQVQTGTIGSTAQSSTYTFPGSASDVVNFTLVATSGSLAPKMRLYNPAGALVSSNYSGSPFGCSGTTVEMNSIALPTSGNYTLLVGDCADTNTGNYSLSSQCFGACPAPAPGFTLNPTSANFGASAGTGTVAVTASPTTASWTAASNSSWIVITSGGSGTGNGTVSYSVAANNSISPRNGSLTVAGITFPVAQAGATPVFTLNPTSVSVGSAATTGTVTITATPPDAPWTAASNASWITVVSGSSGTGSGSTGYNVAANTSASGRTGTLTIAGQSFTVTQAACCAQGLQITSVSQISTSQYQTIVITGSGFGSLSPYTGDSGYIEVFDMTRGWAAGYVGPCYNGTTYYGGTCSDAVTLAVTSWSDSSIVLAGFSGSWGSGGWVLANGDAVEIAVWNAPSGSGPASITTTVGSPSCSFNLSPASASLPATGTSSVETCPNNSGQSNCGVSPETPVAFTVTPTAACGAWTATSSNPGVLQITSGASGSGTGTVAFALLNNTHNGAAELYHHIGRWSGVRDLLRNGVRIGQQPGLP